MMPLRFLNQMVRADYLIGFSIGRWAKEPVFEIEDAYKWLFHACLGGEHAITSDAGPRGWMDREWKTLSAPKDGELLWVPLSPDGQIGRIQMRPYRAAGGNAEDLLQAFIHSAKEFRRTKEEFVLVWTRFGQWLESKPLKHIRCADWVRLDRAVKEDDYPAIDHSEAYLRTAIPAYRVLTLSDLSRLRTLLPGQPSKGNSR